MTRAPMKAIRFSAAAVLLLITSPAYAVPTLLPLLPILGILIAKGALLISSIFFLLLSSIKKNRKLYLVIGIGLLILFALAMIFVRHHV
jgi:acyl-CoA synthetase (AMP-forming)/AMP-acid ligase II